MVMNAVIERHNKLLTGLFEAQWESGELRKQFGAAWRLPLPHQPLRSQAAAHKPYRGTP